MTSFRPSSGPCASIRQWFRHDCHKTLNRAHYFVSFFTTLTLYIKIGCGIDSFTNSILGRTPIISRTVSARLKAESVSFSHNIPICHPRYVWSWVSSGITIKFDFCSFHNSLVGWSPRKAWWNCKK